MLAGGAPAVRGSEFEPSPRASLRTRDESRDGGCVITAASYKLGTSMLFRSETSWTRADDGADDGKGPAKLTTHHLGTAASTYG